MMSTTLPLRPASKVMQPAALAAIQPSALSGTRALITKMTREKWQIRRERMDLDINGAGTFLYSIKTPQQNFSFIAFTFRPTTEGRTGRIIGRSWDMMCSLSEGVATEIDIAKTREELPKLYRGRATPNTLIWGRSNRSMRVFHATLEALTAGRQPEVDTVSNVCYLMRNTGLDGNGTFGTRSFSSLGPDHALGGMLEAQLLTAYLMRELSCDLVSEIARLQSPEIALPLAPELREYFGVGNGSALGLIFYVQKHPRLIDSWIRARETAIATARGLSDVAIDWTGLNALLDRAIRFRREDQMIYESFTSSAQIADDLLSIRQSIPAVKSEALPLNALVLRHEEQVSPEALEMLLSVLVEQVPTCAAELSAQVAGRDDFDICAAEMVGDLLVEIARAYDWALRIDMQAEGAMNYVWYKSETAEEPRRGLRAEIPEARDLGLDLPGDIQRLQTDLTNAPKDQPLSRFLMAHPQHRFMVGRIHGLRGLSYHTPHANIHSSSFVPIDLVRLMNVGLHGIDKTKDYLQRNLRGILFHGAPSPQAIAKGETHTWFYPPEPQL